MDNRSLSLFLHLSQSLHFGKTSQAMHISPSGLTRCIQQLESETNSTLFERDNRSVQLTPAGVALQRYAREVLRLWEDVQPLLQASADQLQGEISIYCSVTASYSFLFDILSQFRGAHPHIHIILRTGDPAQAISRVVNREDNIAIATLPDPLPTTLSFKPITRSPLVLITQKGDPDSHLPTKDLLEQRAFILSESGAARERIDEWFKTQNIQPDIYAQVAGNEAIVSMVSLGFGIGVVPKIVVDNSPLKDQVILVSKQPDLKPFEVGLCTLKRSLKNPLVAALWSTLD